jgi:hypothetical protein
VRGRPALVVLAAAVVAAVLLAVALGEGWFSGRPAKAAAGPAISIQASLSPAAVHFGDTVTARAVLVLDPARIEPASVHFVPHFLSYRVARAERRLSHAAGATTISYIFALECLEAGCGPGRAQVPLVFPAATVRYRTPAGASKRKSVPWPEIIVASRLDAAARAEPATHLRADSSPPPVSYRLSPETLLDGLAGAAGLLVLVAGLLLFLAFRRRPAPERAPPAAPAVHTPLEAALLLVREAASDGHGPALRRLALQRLVRELQGSGRNELARAAGRLAWSDGEPSAPGACALADRVEKELSEER